MPINKSSIISNIFPCVTSSRSAAATACPFYVPSAADAAAAAIFAAEEARLYMMIKYLIRDLRFVLVLSPLARL